MLENALWQRKMIKQLEFVKHEERVSLVAQAFMGILPLGMVIWLHL